MKVLIVQNRMGIGDMVIFLPFVEAISKHLDTPVSLLVKENTKWKIQLLPFKDMLNNNHLKISFRGEKYNYFGIGAKVIVWFDNNVIYKENFLNRGFMSTKSSGLNFGIGTTEEIDSLQVIWPSLKTQKIYSIKAN